MAMPDGTLIFCASASLLLAYGKIKDDVKDEKGGKRLAALAASPFASIMKRKSSKKLAALEKTIENSLECLSQYEKSAHEPSVDRPAEIFGELLSEIFSHGLEGTESKLAKKIGFHVGGCGSAHAGDNNRIHVIIDIFLIHTNLTVRKCYINTV